MKPSGASAGSRVAWCVLALIALGAGDAAIADDTITRIHVGRPARDVLGITVDDDAQGQSIHVGHVRPDGAAARAGLQAGDRIVSVAGCRVHGTQELNAMLAAALPGTSIELGIVPVTGGGGPRSRAPGGAVALASGAGSVLLRLQFATDPGGEGASAPARGPPALVDAPGGVRVTGSAGLLAPQLGPGDLIVAIDRQPVTDAGQAAALLAALRTGGHVVVIVREGVRRAETVAAVASPATAGVRVPDEPCPP